MEKMWPEVLVHREMFSEFLDEMKVSQKLACQSKKDEDTSKLRATRTARELKAMNEKYDTLKDDMRDVDKLVVEMITNRTPPLVFKLIYMPWHV